MGKAVKSDRLYGSDLLYKAQGLPNIPVDFVLRTIHLRRTLREEETRQDMKEWYEEEIITLEDLVNDWMRECGK